MLAEDRGTHYRDLGIKSYWRSKIFEHARDLGFTHARGPGTPCDWGGEMQPIPKEYEKSITKSRSGAMF